MFLNYAFVLLSMLLAFLVFYLFLTYIISRIVKYIGKRNRRTNTKICAQLAIYSVIAYIILMYILYEFTMDFFNYLAIDINITMTIIPLLSFIMMSVIIAAVGIVYYIHYIDY